MFNVIRFLGYFSRRIIHKTITCTINKRLNGLSSEMAFHAMLGLFPAIITVLTAISLFESSIKSTLGDLAIHFEGIVPAQVWTLLLDFTEEVTLTQGKSWFSLSFISAIWIISGAIGSAINALDNIHQVPQAKRRNFWHNKLISILLTIGTMTLLIAACFLLLVGDFLLQVAVKQNWGGLLLIIWKIFTIITIISILSGALYLVFQLKKVRNWRKTGRKNTIIGLTIITSTILIQLVYALFVFVENLIINANLEHTVSFFLIKIWRLLSFPLALGIVALAFAFIYQFGTSIRAKGIPVIPGAIFAAISWAIVSVLFRLYVFYAGAYNKIYGALGTVIVLMLWLYLSSLVMLLGEQLNVILGEEMHN